MNESEIKGRIAILYLFSDFSFQILMEGIIVSIIFFAMCVCMCLYVTGCVVNT